MGAAFLAAAGVDGDGRGFYYEVEVLEARRILFVGLAGTNFSMQGRHLGADACSWGCADQGYVYSYHRSCVATNSDCLTTRIDSDRFNGYRSDSHRTWIGSDFCYSTLYAFDSDS